MKVCVTANSWEDLVINFMESFVSPAEHKGKYPLLLWLRFPLPTHPYPLLWKHKFKFWILTDCNLYNLILNWNQSHWVVMTIKLDNALGIQVEPHIENAQQMVRTVIHLIIIALGPKSSSNISPKSVCLWFLMHCSFHLRVVIKHFPPAPSFVQTYSFQKIKKVERRGKYSPILGTYLLIWYNSFLWFF